MKLAQEKNASPEVAINDVVDLLNDKRHQGKISQEQHVLLLSVYELLNAGYGDLQAERIRGVIQLAKSEGIGHFIKQTKLIQEKNPQNFLPKTRWERLIPLEAAIVSSSDHEEALNCYFLIIRAYVDQAFLQGYQ